MFSQRVCMGAKTQTGVGGVVSSSLERDPVTLSEKTTTDDWQLRSRTTKTGRAHEQNPHK